eukprot:5531846-Pyramimonas_sp.AAC.1
MLFLQGEQSLDWLVTDFPLLSSEVYLFHHPTPLANYTFIRRTSPITHSSDAPRRLHITAHQPTNTEHEACAREGRGARQLRKRMRVDASRCESM